MAHGLHHFDRQGQPIPLERWAELWGDLTYRFIARTWIQEEALEVVTVWEGFDPYRVSFEHEPPRIFRVAELRWAAGKIKNVVEKEMFSSEEAAKTAHLALVSELRWQAGATG